MQGDIFQLESLMASRVIVPKPQQQQQPAATSRLTSDDSSVSIYNEDDLSHLLYVNNHPHHHHHHHHHHQHKQQQPQFIHPADANGPILINAIDSDDMDFDSTPAMSDSESCFSDSASSSSGTDILAPLTPPLSAPEETTTETDSEDAALEAYRRKGRRNALSAKFEDGFEFPVFLGRQDEDAETWHATGPAQEALARASLSLIAPTAVPVKKEAEARHVNAIGGPMMSWWPAPAETMEHDWALENMEWELQMEEAGLRAREREGGIVSVATPAVVQVNGNGDEYETRWVEKIEGPLMSWWPTPAEGMEYEWSERFHE